MSAKETLRNQLLQYSQAILRPENFHDQLAPAVMGYADLLSSYFITDERGGRDHIKTAHGDAIGPFWAARCVREILRTQRFSRGLYAAVSRELKDGRAVHVLYAGTGPFAALALPVMMMFRPQDVRFTFLEINPESIDILKRVIESLELHDYVKDIYQCDAAVWDVPSTGIDIVISETMNRALIKEPQVAIMLNLASQLPQETVFLPEEINVSLCKWDRKNDEVERLAELITFNKAWMYSVINNSPGRTWVFPGQQVQVDLPEGTQLYFMTEIRVNKDNVLKLNESSLNIPEKVKTYGKQGVMDLYCKYSLDGIPGWIVQNSPFPGH